jgi:hypothetical protein
MGTRWWIILVAVAVMAPAVAFAGQAADPVAVLTEIKVGQGEVRVKLASEADWKAPLPLLSLRPGDQIRATQNAKAVLMFTGGQGTVTVAAANSPYTVQAPSAPPGGKTTDLVSSLGRMLSGKKKELAYVPLTTRSVKQPPLLISPRDGKLLGPPVLEWGGSDRLRYTARIRGPQGFLWEQRDLPRTPQPYPASAPALTPGVAYTWELEAKDFPLQRGQFTLVTPGEAAEIQSSLAALNGLAGYPQSTLRLMRAGYLFDQALFADARKELLVALSQDPEEPNLHLLLGHVYERAGLKELAAEEFDEAEFLSSRNP